MGDIVSLMEDRAKLWGPSKLPKETKPSDRATFEELVYEQSFLNEILKHRSRQLKALRKVLKAQEEEFIRLWEYKCEVETKLVGIQRTRIHRKPKVRKETAAEYQERLEGMTQAEVDEELKRLMEMKEGKGGS